MSVASLLDVDDIGGPRNRGAINLVGIGGLSGALVGLGGPVVAAPSAEEDAPVLLFAIGGMGDIRGAQFPFCVSGACFCHLDRREDGCSCSSSLSL